MGEAGLISWLQAPGSRLRAASWVDFCSRPRSILELAVTRGNNRSTAGREGESGAVKSWLRNDTLSLLTFQKPKRRMSQPYFSGATQYTGPKGEGKEYLLSCSPVCGTI